MADIIEDLRAVRRDALTPHNVDQVVRHQEVIARALALLVERSNPATVNTIEAAALQAIREYYDGGKHWLFDTRDDADVGIGPDGKCACSACRKARTFASLIGVDLDKEE